MLTFFNMLAQTVESSTKYDFKEIERKTDSINMYWYNLHHNQYRKCSKYFKKKKYDKSKACYLEIEKLFDVNSKLDSTSLRTTASVYESLIRKADNLFNNRDYENSLEYYEKALLVKPSERYPLDKLKECNKVLGTK